MLKKLKNYIKDEKLINTIQWLYAQTYIASEIGKVKVGKGVI